MKAQTIIKPSRSPQHIDEENWYYEHPKSIELIHEVRIDGLYIRTDRVRIPKAMLKRSLARML